MANESIATDSSVIAAEDQPNSNLSGVKESRSELELIPDNILRTDTMKKQEMEVSAIDQEGSLLVQLI